MLSLDELYSKWAMGIAAWMLHAWIVLIRTYGEVVIANSKADTNDQKSWIALLL